MVPTSLGTHLGDTIFDDVKLSNMACVNRIKSKSGAVGVIRKG